MEGPPAQVLHQVGGGAQTDIELHLGIAPVVLLQPLQHRRDVGVDDPDLQHAPQAGVHVTDAVHDGPQALEHLLALLVEAAARLGQLHPLVGAQEEAHPQLVLQLGDLPADGGLGHMEDPGGGRKAARLGHGGEILKLSEIHSLSYLFYISIISQRVLFIIAEIR